jgi:hypothetical protein
LSYFPAQAKRLNDLMTSLNYHVNVSYKITPARSVSNLVNFYSHPEWAACEYHIINLDKSDEVVVITRNKKVLDNIKTGDLIVAHNFLKETILYKF